MIYKLKHVDTNCNKKYIIDNAMYSCPCRICT